MRGFVCLFKQGVLALVITLLVLPGPDGSGSTEAGESGEWLQAMSPRTWKFPEDHGSHPAYRTEWWYFTGNLSDKTGGQYGYQLTFFRQGISQKVRDSKSSWSIRDLYFAHFAITDVGRNQFHLAESLSRAGPGLAGAKAEKMEVWILNWSATMNDAVIKLKAEKDGMKLTLDLRPRKPLVLHGDNGLSAKGPGRGQASYYVSFTDLETSGILKTDQTGSPKAVSGTSWFDHEFGSNQLTREQAGWDWFSLHLSDRRDLMVYLLRKKDGTIEPASSGTVVEADGSFRHLSLADIAVSVSAQWTSARSGARYPSQWTMRIPSAGIELTMAPLVPDQELNPRGSAGLTYWEGAVAGSGTSRGTNVRCEGYVELTGYAGSLGGTF
jgi:predicted secreted hydrolase